MDQKFRQNCSISHRFRDKRVFAFYTEIQDDHQKWWENDVWETVADDSVNTLGVKNFVKIVLFAPFPFARSIFPFVHFTICILRKNSIWHQKWRENNFWQKVAGDCIHALWLKDLAEIARSRTVYEINTFLHFMQIFKMAAQNGDKMILGKNCIRKIFVEVALCRTVSEVNTF